MRLRHLVFLCALFVGGMTARAQNPNPEILSFPGFETTQLMGWTAFGNAFLETANPPRFVPASGTNLVSMFGLFSGPMTQSDSGVFERFLANPGETYEMNAKSRHFSGDALTGQGLPSGNAMVMRIAFFDSAQAEIGGASRVILDGNFATDVWHEHEPVTAQAPPGTVTVQALIIFIQPGLDPGAAHVDDVTLKRSLGLTTTQDPVTDDVTIALDSGEPLVLYGTFWSADPLNGSNPGEGPFGGLFISPSDFNDQLTLVLAQVPPFGGVLDASGGTSITLPGSFVAPLSGATLYGLGVQLYSSVEVGVSAVRAITLQ